MRSFDLILDNWNRKQKGQSTSYEFDRVLANRSLDEIADMYDSWHKGASSYTDSYNSRYFDEEGNYISKYRNDHNDWSSGMSKQRDELTATSDQILSLLDKYGTFYDEDYVTSLSDSLKSGSKSIGDIGSNILKEDDFYRTYKTEDDYNAAVAAQKEYEELSGIDLGKTKASMDFLKDEISAVEDLKNEVYWLGTRLETYATENAHRNKSEVQAEMQKLQEEYNLKQQTLDELLAKGYDQQLADLKTKYDKAEKIQTANRINGLIESAKNDPEYAKYVQIGASVDNPSVYESQAPFAIGNWKPFGDGEEIKNPVTFYLDNQADIEISMANNGRFEEYDPVIAELSQEQVDNYNYLFGKYGRTEADLYLEQAREEITGEKNKEFYEDWLEDKWLAEILYSGVQGLDQFSSGMQAVFGIEDKSILDPQAIGAMARDDLGGFGRLVYDLGTTTANMVPSLLAGAAVGSVNPIAGAWATNILMGVSSGGNAYQDAINRGYSKEQARTYGVLTGASEALMGKLLGSVGNAGSSLTGQAVSNMVNGIDNAFWRGSLKVLGNMASEGLEEGMQEVLSPFIENLALNANNDWSDIKWADVAYSGLLGALSAGLLESVQTYSNEYRVQNAGQAVKDAGQVSNLVKFGQSLSVDSVAYELAGKVDENTGAYTIGRLLYEAGADSLSETNLADITTELERRGVAPEYSKVIAKWMNKAVGGETLTKTQQMALDYNEDLGEVIRDVIINKNSTVNQRLLGYKGIVATTSFNQAVDKARKQMAKSAQKSTDSAVVDNAEDNSTTEVENAAESKFEVNTDGKTINNATGDIINVQEIASIKDGKMTLKLDNGETVNADDVSFGTESDALIYSTVLDMGVNAAVANSIVKNYNPADGVSAYQYARGVQEAYKYGRYNIPASEMSGKAFSADLTPAQRTHAYNLGQSDARAEVSAQQKAISEAVKNSGTKKSEKGKVHFDGDRTALTKIQRVSLETIEKIADSLSVNFHIFESRVENGKRVYTNADGNVVSAPNGMYYSDGSIYIDLNAGVGGRGTMLFTAAHELTHYIKQWSPAKFKVLADFLMEQYGKQGVSVSTLVRQQIAKAKRNGRTIDYDTAFEEVVADSMETMLADGKVAEKLAMLKQKDKGLVNKIKQFFSELAKKIRDVYAGLNPDSREGRYVAEMKDAIDHIQELFTDALVDASENYASASTQESVNNSDGAMFSERDYPIDADVEKTVNAAFTNNKSTMNELSNITAEQNKAINRLVNQTKDNSYRGKYEGGKHKFSDTAIRHIMAEHGDFLREGLRAQLPMRREDIARHLSAIKDNKTPSSIKPTRTARGNPSILTSYEVNGYTLYAEEITKSLGKNLPSDLIGHTMYKAPTLATAATLATSARVLPRRQSQVLCTYNTPNTSKLSTANFVADKNGIPALLSYVKHNGSPKVDILHGGLIALSSDASNFTNKVGTVEQGYVVCEKPYYITQEHRVFDNSKSDVSAKISELKKQGYDCFIFDKVAGDNYMVAVVNKAQIVNSTPTKLSDRDSSGRELTEAQVEYFKDSKVRDADGNLQVVYHGTRKADFTVFKRNVNYFTDSKEMADSYSPNGDMYEGYVNITKPYEIDASGEKWSSVPIDDSTKALLEQYGSSVFKENGKWRTTPADIASAIEEAVDNGELDYDGIIIKNVDDTGSYYKGEGKHLATDYITFAGKQFKNADNTTPTADPDIRYALRDDTVDQKQLNELREQLKEKQSQIYSASMELRKFDDKAAQDKLFAVLNKEGVTQQEIDEALQAYSIWGEESGFSNASKKQSALKDEEKLLYREIQKIEDKLRKELQEQIAHWDAEDVKKYVAKAVRKYRTTTRLDKASYLVTTGSMLDFSDGQGYRVKDHREISEILDLPDYAGYSDGMIAFMNMGNIRLQTYGIDVSAMPTDKQFSTLRDIIFSVMRDEGAFSVDFSKPDGYSAGSVTYGKGTSASKIISDIKSYFETGVVPEEQSGIRDFLYSDRVTDEEALDFLNEQIERGEYITVYRSFQVIDGGLYAPMNAVDRDEDGKNKRLGYRSEIGQWEMATESKAIAQRYMDAHPDAPYAKFDLDGVDNKTGGVAYNPYLHASNLVLNDQFAAAYRRNLVTVECRVPLSEADGAYKAEYAKDGTGWASWKAGGVAGQLKKAKPDFERKLFLSRYMLPVRILSDAEVANMYKGYLDGTDISVPWNVVTPSLRNELEKVGVNISYEDVNRSNGPLKFADQFPEEASKVLYSDRDIEQEKAYQKVTQQLSKENAKLREDLTYLKELLKLQGKVTHGKMLSKTSLQAVAKRLMTSSNAKGDISELVNHLNDVYSYILSGEDVSWEGVSEKATGAIDWLIDHEHKVAKRDEYSDMILKELRTTRVSLNDAQKAEAIANFGSLREFRNKVMGSIIIANDGAPLDSVWNDLSRSYPAYFDPEMSDANQAVGIVEAIEALRSTEVEEGYYEYEQEMVAQDLLTKVYDAYWDVATLHTVADAKQKEINLLKSKHKQKMDALRQSHMDKDAALRKSHRENMQKLREEYRDRADAKLKKQAEQYRESREKAVDNRQKTALKQSIKRVVNRLNSMLNKGNRERNVKVGLRDTVASALDAAEILFNTNVTNDDIVRNGIDFATDEDTAHINEYRELLERRDSIIAQIDAMTQGDRKSIDLDKIDALYADIDKIDARIAKLNGKLAKVFEMERARLSKATVSDAIGKVAEAYESIKTSEDEYIKNAYDEYVAVRLSALKESVGGTLVKDMSVIQLRELYDVFTAIAHTVANANTMFRNGKAEDLAKRTGSVQWQIMSHLKKLKDPRSGINKLAEALKDFAWNEMKPLTAFETLGSESFTELFWDLIEAQGKWGTFMEESKSFLEEQRKKYGYKSWDMESAHEFTLSHGKKFKLTLQDMMSIYAYSKREQAYEHMTSGGFQFAEHSEYKEDGAKRIHLTGDLYATQMQDINRIVAELSKVDGGKVVQYVDAVQKYLTELGKKGNEVSRVLYGIDLFNETAYFPLMSSKDYRSSVEAALNNTQTQVSLKNTGMTKQTVPHAKNPIILQGFDTVAQNHIKKMADYCTQVLPIENLRRVFDSTTVADNGDSVSTKAIIKKVFGDSAMKYFDQYITDVNGGALMNGAQSPLMSMFNRFKATAVGASLSVVVQQPMAIVRAMEEIAPKYFVFGQAGKSETEKLYDEIKKYAPVAIIKEMGGFDTGSNRSATDYLGTRTDKGYKRVVDEVSDKSMWLASKADVLGWNIIWQAVKREVNASKQYQFGSKAYYEACGKRFTEVVTRTQVYDSVNSRSGYMRSKSDLMKFATSFLGEPTTVINEAYLAILNVRRATDGPTKRKAYAKLGRTMGVLLASTLLTTLAKSFVYAMRDDDDESLLERWSYQTGKNLGLWGDLNPLTLLPLVKDIVSLFEGWDVERPDMTLIANAIKSYKKLFDDGATFDEWVAAVGDTGNLIGVPVKNAIRDGKGIYKLFKDIFDDVAPTDVGGAFGAGISGEKYTEKTRVENAFDKGDTQEVKRVVDDMISEKVDSGKTAKEAKSAVRSSFTSTYKEQYVEAYEKGDRDEMNRIRKLLFATGLYGKLSELDDTLKKWRKTD